MEFALWGSFFFRGKREGIFRGCQLTLSHAERFPLFRIFSDNSCTLLAHFRNCFYPSGFNVKKRTLKNSSTASSIFHLSHVLYELLSWPLPGSMFVIYSVAKLPIYSSSGGEADQKHGTFGQNPEDLPECAMCFHVFLRIFFRKMT